MLQINGTIYDYKLMNLKVDTNTRVVSYCVPEGEQPTKEYKFKYKYVGTICNNLMFIGKEKCLIGHLGGELLSYIEVVPKEELLNKSFELSLLFNEVYGSYEYNINTSDNAHLDFIFETDGRYGNQYTSSFISPDYETTGLQVIQLDYIVNYTDTEGYNKYIGILNSLIGIYNTGIVIYKAIYTRPIGNGESQLCIRFLHLLDNTTFKGVGIHYKEYGIHKYSDTDLLLEESIDVFVLEQGLLRFYTEPLDVDEV